LPIPVRLSLPAELVELTPDASPWRWTLILAPTYFFFNRVAASRVRKAVAEILLKAAHGTDISGSVLAYTGPWPLPLKQPHEGLPRKISTEIEEQVSLRMGSLGAEIRQIFARAALDGVPWQGMAATVARVPGADKALAHTSYFDHPNVVRLICLHIAHCSPAGKAQGAVNDPELEEWRDLASDAAAQRFAEFTTAFPG